MMRPQAAAQPGCVAVQSENVGSPGNLFKVEVNGAGALGFGR